MIYLLVFAMNATTLVPNVATNCEPMSFEQGKEAAALFVGQFQSNGAVCSKRDGIYEWICAETKSNSMFTVTLKKELADCKATPARTANLLKTMTKKPTL